jgi:NAD(P)H-dependent nitrite reductase small subunit
MQTATASNTDWIDICALDDLPVDMGIGALIHDKQIALFHLQDDQAVYAVSNYDPFSGANVIARGIVGSLGEELVVASPIYKQHFSLQTGRCLEDDAVSLAAYPVKIENGRVLVQNI